MSALGAAPDSVCSSQRLPIHQRQHAVAGRQGTRARAAPCHGMPGAGWRAQQHALRRPAQLALQQLGSGPCTGVGSLQRRSCAATDRPAAPPIRNLTAQLLPAGVWPKRQQQRISASSLQPSVRLANWTGSSAGLLEVAAGCAAPPCLAGPGCGPEGAHPRPYLDPPQTALLH